MEWGWFGVVGRASGPTVMPGLAGTLLLLLLVGCVAGGQAEAASCDQVVDRSARLLIETAEDHAEQAMKGLGLDPDRKLGADGESPPPDEMDRPEPQTPGRPQPQDADPWELIEHYAADLHDQEDREEEARRLRAAGETLGCGPVGWAKEPVAALLREDWAERTAEHQCRPVTVRDYFLSYTLAPVHLSLTGEHIAEPLSPLDCLDAS